MSMNEKELDFMEYCLENSLIEVKFTKADGSERIMKCTKNFNYIPEDDVPAGNNIVTEVTDLIRVYDVDVGSWRSFKPSRVIEWKPVEE